MAKRWWVIEGEALDLFYSAFLIFSYYSLLYNSALI